ncbi:MAG: glycosyltransferase [Magnetospirillum sp.]|nr:glycosyltransferase [Magnetospirillum sp.]
MTLPTISLVTACLNQAPFIRQTVESVLGQGYPALEYLVQDGGSSDGTREILADYGDRLTLVGEPDRGLYDALNRGFARSSGEVMGYLNGDDIHLPWTLSVVGEIFSSFPEVEWVSTLHPLAMDERGRVVRCRTRREAFSVADFLRGGTLPAPQRPGVMWIQQESTFWRRSLWERAGCRFDDTLRAAGDFELWGRFFSLASLVGVDTPLAAFRRRPGQLSSAGGYEGEAAAVLARLGGRPRGPVAGLVRLAMRRLRPRAEGPVCRWDWGKGRWRLDGGEAGR